MLAQGYELLRTILDNQVDYYKASRSPHHVDDFLAFLAH